MTQPAAPLGPPAVPAGPVPAPVLSPKDRLLRRVIESGLLGLLVLSPLPAASTGDWAILAIELWIAALTAAYLLLDRKPRLNPHLAVRLTRLRPFVIGLFVFLGFQALPLPKAVAGFLSPAAYALRSRFDPDFARKSWLSLSLVPSHTIRGALELGAYVLAAFLVLKTVTRRRQIQRLIVVLAASGAFQAVYGLFELSRSEPRILFYPKTFNLSSATGTFVNRNHFAGYLEMIIPLALGLVLSRIDLFGLAGRKLGEMIARISEAGFAGNLVLTAAALVMAVGLFKSNSRSGVFVLALIFFLFFELTALHFARNRLGRTWIQTFLRVLFVALTLVLLYAGTEATIGRFALDNLLQDGRPLYWANVLTMISRFPLFGTGFATFGAVYPAFGTVALEGRLLHAHNDILEALSELGLAGFVLLAGIVGYLLADGFRTWSGRRNTAAKALGMGGLVSAFALLVHSLTDFNLRIPANALLFSVVLGLAVVVIYYRKA